MSNSMPTKEEFNLTERPYVWLRDLSRLVDNIMRENNSGLGFSIPTFIESLKANSGRITALENQAKTQENTALNYFGTMLVDDNFVDLTVPEYILKKKKCTVFVEESGHYVNEPYIGCGLVSSTVIRIEKSESIGELNFKLVLEDR